jgi:hypothetical protein
MYLEIHQSPRKIYKRGLIPTGSLFSEVWYSTKIYLKGSDTLPSFVHFHEIFHPCECTFKGSVLFRVHVHVHVRDMNMNMNWTFAIMIMNMDTDTGPFQGTLAWNLVFQHFVRIKTIAKEYILDDLDFILEFVEIFETWTRTFKWTRIPNKMYTVWSDAPHKFVYKGTSYDSPQKLFTGVWYHPQKFVQGDNCSWSRRRLQKVDKRMVLEHTHGLFIT